MPHRLTFALDWGRLGLLVVALAMLLNSFVACLQAQFVPQIDRTSEYTQQKFLGYPGDLHADLIAFDLCFAPFTPVDPTSWPYPYRKFLLQNHYHSFDLSSGTAVDITTWSWPLSPQDGEDWEWKNPNLEMAGRGLDQVPSGLHTTPLILCVAMLMKRLILARGPEFAVVVHYALAFLALAYICLAALPDWPRRLWAFVTLALSYPFVEILLRGNQGALLTSAALIGFIWLVCRADHSLLAPLLLAIACNVRPNAVLLAPLFLCFGRRAFTSLAVFAAAGILLFLAAYKMDQVLYPGYQLVYFLRALTFYYQDFVLNLGGNSGNNSLYGGIKLIFLFLTHSHGNQHHHVLDLINKGLALAALIADVGVGAAYFYRKLSRLEFSFLVAAIYLLASAIFATYHLFVFAVFPLLLCDPKTREFGRSDFLILASSVFLLMPKSYFFYHGITPDAVLNPLLVLAAAAYLVFYRWKIPVPARA